ncbi:MAG: hypothetical protein EA398_12110 [Deltaproteobacteria bacterium]|nr:MAG: hypothetical protein EA398_12110 [Deltaproteobacteria bacterium]
MLFSRHGSAMNGNGIVNVLLRESWNTTRDHWRALLVATAVASVVSLVAFLPALGLLMTPESEWTAGDAAWRFGLAFVLTTAAALVFETWIAGLAEARRLGEAVSHARILRRSLTVLPSITGASLLFMAAWWLLLGGTFGLVVGGAMVHPLLAVPGTILFVLMLLVLSTVSMAFPVFYSVLCAVGYTKGRGPLASLGETVRLFRAHPREALVLTGVCIGAAFVVSIPSMVLLFPVFLLLGVSQGLDAPGLLLLLVSGSLLAVAIHTAHTVESIVTSHVYPVMRHFGLAD